MNDPPHDDPRLARFASRLAAMPPRVSPVRQQQMLYACAFAAGKSKADRLLWRWQAVAALLGLLMLGVSVPLARDHLPIARHAPKPMAPVAEPSRQPPDRLPPVEVATKLATVDLDAWQTRTPDDESLAAQVAQLKRIDPQHRSLSVGRMTRAALQP